MLEYDHPASRFELTWTQTSLLSEILFESHNDDTILGSLTVSIPFVLFRGLPFCAEVVKACDDSFIESTIQSINSLRKETTLDSSITGTEQYCWHAYMNTVSSEVRTGSIGSKLELYKDTLHFTLYHVSSVFVLECLRRHAFFVLQYIHILVLACIHFRQAFLMHVFRLSGPGINTCPL
jgi:hypothetical protein